MSTNRREIGATALALLLLAGTVPLGAQVEAGRVMGRVVSSHTGEPLAAVQVTIPAISRGTLSDANGATCSPACRSGMERSVRIFEDALELQGEWKLFRYQVD